MEEEEIKQIVPDIYESIIKTEEEVDWALLKEDLEELNWLKLDLAQADESIISVWKVADRWGVSVLQSNPRFKLLKVTKVKIPITNYMYNASTSNVIKQICQEAQTKIEEMLFFACAKGLLNSASEEEFQVTIQRIYDIFTEFKASLTCFFLHFDKTLKVEINNTLSGLLDSVFYSKVLKAFSEKLASDEKTKKILNEFSEKKSTVQMSAYSNDHSSWARENIYRGQVGDDGKRDGFGKVTYFGGDSYEGYWKNDKPDGLGLYSWKIGGRYLGEFVRGVLNGQGVRVYSSGNYYEGNFLNGKKHGLGVMRFKNGDVYDGSWEDDFMQGEGKYTWSSGDVFIGRFLKDVREGPGILHLASQETISGTWKENLRII